MYLDSTWSLKSTMDGANEYIKEPRHKCRIFSGWPVSSSVLLEFHYIVLRLAVKTIIIIFTMGCNVGAKGQCEEWLTDFILQTCS